MTGTRPSADAGDPRIGALRTAVEVLASPADPLSTVTAWTHAVAQGFADVACVHQVDPARHDGLRRTADARPDGRLGAFSFDSPALLTAVHDALVSRRRRRTVADHAAVLVVPVLAQGDVLGAATFVSGDAGRWDRRDDRTVAEALAALLAQPLAGLALTEHDAGDPTGSPRAVPPRARDTPGLEVAMATDGDRGAISTWVDAIPLAAMRTGLVAGEVGVKGPLGADLARRLRYSVRALATVDVPPDVLLRHLGDLVRRFDPGVFVTCTYAVHDAATGEVLLANAGHVPPLLVDSAEPGTYRAAGTAIGAPLGIGSHGVRTSKVRLHPGAVLALSAGSLAESDRLSVLGEQLASLAEGDLAAAAPLLLHPSDDDDGTAASLLLVRGCDTGVRHAVHDLPDGPEAATAGRLAARETRARWGLEAHGETIDLIVTELVTNAVRHARPPFSLRMIRGPGTFVGEVFDASMRAPAPRLAGWEEEQGRGLQITAQLADRWGYRQLAEGKSVWFELDVAS